MRNFWKISLTQNIVNQLLVGLIENLRLHLFCPKKSSVKTGAESCKIDA